MDTDAIIVVCPCPSAEVAEGIGRALLERRLIACAHIPAAGRSLYWWQGKIDEGQEVFALFKTREALFSEVEAAICALHPYEVPGIAAMRVAQGHEAFLNWIREQTAG